MNEQLKEITSTLLDLGWGLSIPYMNNNKILTIVATEAVGSLCRNFLISFIHTPNLGYVLDKSSLPSYPKLLDILLNLTPTYIEEITIH